MLIKAWRHKNNIPSIELLTLKTKQYINNKDWYKNSNKLIKKRFKEYNLFIDILSITSPRTSVKRNCTNAIETYNQVLNNQKLTVQYGLTHANTKRNIDLMLKSNKFKGQKVNSFSNALKLKDNNNIVIDTWMLKAFNLKRKSPLKNDIEHINTTVKTIAKKLNLKPYEVQACLWVYAKSELNNTTVKESYDFSYYLKAYFDQTKLNIGGTYEKSYR